MIGMNLAFWRGQPQMLWRFQSLPSDGVIVMSPTRRASCLSTNPAQHRYVDLDARLFVIASHAWPRESTALTRGGFCCCVFYRPRHWAISGRRDRRRRLAACPEPRRPLWPLLSSSVIKSIAWSTGRSDAAMLARAAREMGERHGCSRAD